MQEKILIVDDHPVVLDGLRLLLDSLYSNAVFTTVSNGADALAILNDGKTIDWAFVDINLPDTEGLDLVETLVHNELIRNVIVLSSEIPAKTIHHALLLGVNGVLSKGYAKDVFELCILTVNLGKVFLTAEHANELNYYRESLSQEETHIRQELSARQQETLKLLSEGLTNVEIAKTMNISESTVKTHVSSLMVLFDVTNRTQCVIKARKLNLL